MSTVLELSPARPTVLRATPWVAGAWALTFGCLSALALLDRAPIRGRRVLRPPWAGSPPCGFRG